MKKIYILAAGPQAYFQFINRLNQWGYLKPKITSKSRQILLYNPLMVKGLYDAVVFDLDDSHVHPYYWQILKELRLRAGRVIVYNCSALCTQEMFEALVSPEHLQQLKAEV
jgi:hypothetical protein